jgi:16S rRNA (adenine1518-N6/adenine1519-N6)-dimethyltransferase
VNCYFDVTKEFAIPARFFTPSPKVHSVVVVLEKREPRVSVVDEKKFFAFVTGIFRYRRKSVKNAIAHFLHCTPDGIERSISMKRPADLSLKDYYRLYSRIVRQ